MQFSFDSSSLSSINSVKSSRRETSETWATSNGGETSTSNNLITSGNYWEPLGTAESHWWTTIGWNCCGWEPLITRGNCWEPLKPAVGNPLRTIGKLLRTIANNHWEPHVVEQNHREPVGASENRREPTNNLPITTGNLWEQLGEPLITCGNHL